MRIAELPLTNYVFPKVPGVFVNHARIILIAFATALALGACSGGSDARQPTQTPWIIEKIITATPEPATFTPLAPVTEPKAAATPTRAAVATARPAPTRTPTRAPVVVAPTAAPAPACNISGTVSLEFPENGTERHTKKNAVGGDAFEFRWGSPLTGPTDTQTGYRVDIESRRLGTNAPVSGATYMLSHNKSLENIQNTAGKRLIMDKAAVKALTGGDDVTVYWSVTIVRAAGSFDDQTYAPVPVVPCGPASPRWTIKLVVED